MPIIDIRELLEFPTTPGNASDTFIGGVHFNLTTLQFYNYTYYSNHTLSNGSWCMLAFDQYTPHLLANGTFLNSTSCYVPINNMGARGGIGIGFGAFFAVTIMFTLINLRKHGRLFLPAQVRFLPIGRRWQWYWMLAVAGCAMASSFGAVDVDRYYVAEFPIVLTNLGYFLMLPCLMGAVWEAVRHWGAWQERQVIDPDPFALPQNDKRGKTEFYMPLIFYLFNFLNFFMTIPRAWVPIEMQRDDDQTDAIAKPSSTDVRFKAGAFLLFLAWCVICFSLWHSLHHYKPRNRGALNSCMGFFQYTPVKFLLTIPLALAVVAYEAYIAFDWSRSPLNAHGDVAFIYGWGWAPIALIILIYEIAGYIDPNEDRDLIRQRRVRGAEIDAEMGYTKKPHWWSRLHGDINLSVQDAIAKNVREVGGGAVKSRTAEGGIEMGNLSPTQASTGGWERNRMSQNPEAVRLGAQLLFPTRSGRTGMLDPFSDSGPTEESPERGRAGSTAASSTTRDGAISDRSNSTSSGTTLNAPPQKIRSMLDI